MQERSLHDLLGLGGHTVPPQLFDTNGTVTGAEVDLTDSDAQGFLAYLGAWVDADLELRFFEGDTSGSLTEVAKDDLRINGGALVDGAGSGGNRVVQDDATQDNKLVAIGYIGGKRFVRCDVVVTGTPTTGNLASVAVLASRLRSRGMTPMSARWLTGSVAVDQPTTHAS